MHDAHDDVAATRLRRPRSLHTPPLTTASTEKPQHRIGAEALGVVLGTVGEVEKLAFRIYGSPLKALRQEVPLPSSAPFLLFFSWR